MGGEQRCHAKYILVQHACLVFHYIKLPWITTFSIFFWFNYDADEDEQKFLEASMAYVAGKPIMNDEEYDKLKLKLKVWRLSFLCVSACTHYIVQGH